MSERGPIVCGTDLSPTSQVNVELAARMAAALQRPLHLLYVTGGVVDDAEPASEAERVFRERLKQRVEAGRAALEKAASFAEGLGPHVETHLLSGRPWEALIAHATKVDPAILAVGPHGHSGPIRTSRVKLGEWLLGSTADRVVRHSRWPVLVGPREAGEHAPSIGNGRWIVAVDFSPQARAALRLAASLAGPCGAKITVVHALHGPYAQLDPMGDAEPFPPMGTGERDRVEAELNGFVKGEIGESLDLHLAVGAPSVVIATAAERLGAKLVIMGTHGRTGLSHLLLGSAAERTLRRSPAPVLVVPS